MSSSNPEYRSDKPHKLSWDFKKEMGFAVAAVALFAVLLAYREYPYAVGWLMFSLFSFGIWRIGKGRFR